MNFSELFSCKCPYADPAALDRYLQFIAGCTVPEPGAYQERHHILPKSIFPEFRLASLFPSNQVRISAVNHFKAHYLLWRVIPSDHRLLCAWKQMWCNKYGAVDAATLAQHADAYAEAKEVHADYMRTRAYSEATRSKMSASAKTKVFTKEHRANMSKAKTGHKHSDETKRKIKETNLGQKRTDESKARMSAAQKCAIITDEERSARADRARSRFTGRPKTEEEIRKTAEANRGKKRSPEFCARMSDLAKHRVLTDAARAALAEGRKRRHD